MAGIVTCERVGQALVAWLENATPEQLDVLCAAWLCDEAVRSAVFVGDHIELLVTKPDGSGGRQVLLPVLAHDESLTGAGTATQPLALDRDWLEEIVKGWIFTEATVENWGAVGDGETNDLQSITAMATATGGHIRFMAKSYVTGNMIYSQFEKVTVEGAGQPLLNAARTGLFDGTGTVILGAMNLRARSVKVANLGQDTGVTRPGLVATDGIVANAPQTGLGGEVVFENVSSVGPDEAGFSHGLLIQGFSNGRITNVVTGHRQFGVVSKSQNLNIDNVFGFNLRTANVYLKSDEGAVSGDVANGLADNNNVNNVVTLASGSNAEVAGVYVHASTVPLQGANISNVYQFGGGAPVKMAGAGTDVSNLVVTEVNVSNISSRNAQFGIQMIGFCIRFNINNVRATDPGSGRLVYMDGISRGYQITNVSGVYTNSNNDTVPAIAFFGTGSFDNITVESPTLERIVQVPVAQLGNIRTGKVLGNARMNGDQALTGINGATAVAAPNAPRIKVDVNSVLQLSGTFDLTGSTNPAFSNLPITLTRSISFVAVGVTTDGLNVPVAVTISGGFQLNYNAPADKTLSSISLEGVRLPVTQ